MSTTHLTNRALFKISRELICLGTFDSNLVKIEGSPKVDEKGVLSSLNNSDFVYYDEINISNNEILINTNATYNNLEETQCLWCLWSSVQNVLSLIVSTDSISVYFGNTVLCTFGNGLALVPNTPVNIKVKVTSTNCEISVLNNGNYFDVSSPIEEPIDLLNYTNIKIGTNNSHYWAGDISLPAFSIMSGSTLVYSPAEEPSFNLSKIIISDGEFPLTDSSTSILNHVYEIPISDIVRSENTVYLKATIDEDIYLNIKQIGVYDTSEGNPMLFALIDNLNIYKNKDLPYDLIFSFDLSLRVVNITGFPAEGDIVMNDVENTSTTDFYNLKKIQTYCLTDLERLIKNNAMQIGYNRSQVFYQKQRELEQTLDTYKTIQNYLKLCLLPNHALQQYYHIPSIPSISYRCADINNPGYYLNVMDTSVKGNGDFINLNRSATLCIKAHLKNVENKIILLKQDSHENIYFIFKIENQVLSFTIYLTDTKIELIKELSIDEYSEYVENPILFTVTYNEDSANPVFSLYKNTELIANYDTPIGSLPDITYYKLSNFLPTTENPEIYFSDIIFMSNAASASTISYLCDLLGTNIF